MDLDNGDIGYAFDEFGENSKGEQIMYVGDGMIENLETGELHFVDHWPDDPDDRDDDDEADDDDDDYSFSYHAYSGLQDRAPLDDIRKTEDDSQASYSPPASTKPVRHTVTAPGPKSYLSFDSVESNNVYTPYGQKKPKPAVDEKAENIQKIKATGRFYKELIKSDQERERKSRRQVLWSSVLVVGTAVLLIALKRFEIDSFVCALTGVLGLLISGIYWCKGVSDLAETGKRLRKERDTVYRMRRELAGLEGKPVPPEPKAPAMNLTATLLIFAAAAVLTVYLSMTVIGNVRYNQGVRCFNQGIEYYQREEWYNAYYAFTKAADRDIENAEQWALMSQSRSSISYKHYGLAESHLNRLLEMECSDDMKREAEELLAYSKARQAETEREEKRIRDSIYGKVPYVGMYVPYIPSNWEWQGTDNLTVKDWTGNRVRTTKYRYDDPPKIYIIWVDEDNEVVKVSVTDPTAPSKKRKTSKPKTTNDPYGASDYAHPDDFYYDYPDDFWDYEDAEDYWAEYG